MWKVGVFIPNQNCLYSATMVALEKKNQNLLLFGFNLVLLDNLNFVLHEVELPLKVGRWFPNEIYETLPRVEGVCYSILQITT